MNATDALPLLRDAALLLLAWLLGGVIGWQREAQGRAAGLRTHMLVCGGACLITLVSVGIGDSGRIAAQIVSGIGFLGAGVILRRGISVHGLTTAASVWVVAGIGIAVGSGGRFAVLGALGTLYAWLTLTVVKRIEERLRRDSREAILMAMVHRNTGATSRLMALLSNAGAVITHFSVEAGPEEGERRRLLQVSLRLPKGITTATLTDRISDAFPDTEFEWE